MNCSRRAFVHSAGSALAIASAAGAGGISRLRAAVVPDRANSDPCHMPATDLARNIRQRQVSAREVMSAFLERIARLNPKINALVAKLDDAKCLALADEADRRLARGDAVGPLHGLPFAFKDNEPAVGFPFTRGSPIFAGQMPKEDTVVVERIRRAGVIPIAKTNVPEFALGSHTYNKVYGTTWMKSAYWITVTHRPAISVPAGFTSSGLPVGLQIVGRYRGDFAVLQMAHLFEQATSIGRRRPQLPL